MAAPPFQIMVKLAPGQPDFATETAVRAFEPVRPYPQNPSAIIYRTRFKQFRAYYTKPVPNTPHPDLPQVYFADDVDFQDQRAGLVEWTRIYVTIPGSWNDFDSYAYTFPGFGGIRVPLAKVVTAKLTFDYFAVANFVPFSTNTAAYDDLNNAAWIKSQATTTGNAAAIPACAGGNVVAAKLIEDATNTSHLSYQVVNLGGTGIFSSTVFVKSNTRSRFRLEITNSTITTTVASLDVDLNTGAILSNAGNGCQVMAIGDGWWRLGLIGNTAFSNIAMIAELLDNTGQIFYQGDNASGLFVWRMQAALGNAYPHATVPPLTTPDATNYPIASADFVPVKFGIQYIYAWSQNVAAEYLSAATSPTLANYYTNAASFVNSDSANVNSYSIEATDSTLGLWQGSIWQRQRRFVKAR